MTDDWCHLTVSSQAWKSLSSSIAVFYYPTHLKIFPDVINNQFYCRYTPPKKKKKKIVRSETPHKSVGPMPLAKRSPNSHAAFFPGAIQPHLWFPPWCPHHDRPHPPCHWIACLNDPHAVEARSRYHCRETSPAVIAVKCWDGDPALIGPTNSGKRRF